jgi:hypothetical protein
MFRQSEDYRRAGIVALAVGTTIGAAAAVLLGVRSRRRRQEWRIDTTPELLQLETAVVDALSEDEVAGNLPLEVEAIAPGIIELSGTIETEGESDRAVAVVHRVPGVKTVLNRMDLRPEVEHFAETRRRFADGAPQLRESRWFGVGVGTGRRRQSPLTDPARPDDSVRMRTTQYENERHGEAFEAQHQEPGTERDAKEL